MPHPTSSLDHRLDRLFTLLGTGTLRSRERYLSQVAQASWAREAATAAGSTPAVAAHMAAPSSLDRQFERLFALLAAGTLRRRERFMAQQPAPRG